MSKEEIKFSLTSTLENASSAGDRIKAVCAGTALAKDQRNLVHNAVMEALNNIVEHAYEGRPDGLIEVSTFVSSDRIIIRVRDSGRHYEGPKRRYLDFNPGDLTSLPERGMGLFIIGQVMDRTTYEVIDDKNVLTMTKLLGKPQMGNTE